MKDIEQVIHASADADLTGYTYTSVYASAAATPTINGTAVAMIAGGTINVLVKSITSTANVYVLGRKRLIPPQVING